MSLLDRLHNIAPAPAVRALPAIAAETEDEGPSRFGRSPVGWSRDLARVVDLPRRSKPDTAALIEKWTLKLKKPDGAQSLFPIQAWALEEMSRCAGLLGPISVGGGKSLLNLLAALVVPDCRVAVLLIPPSLRAKFYEQDLEFYGKSWTLPNIAGARYFVPGRPVLHVVSYSELSGAKSTDLLERIRPDLIIADEAHHVRSRSAARTKRFMRYFSTHPQTRFCGWSGTLTSRSIKDFAHLSELALRDGSPLPRHFPTLEEWAGAIDPSDFQSPIGQLRKLCEPGEHVRAGFRRRLVDTPGVVATEEGALGTSLVIQERPMAQIPPAVSSALDSVRKGWQRPDGEELVDAMSVARCAREVACGFFYRWRFPRKEAPEVIKLWLERRKAWHKELREKLKQSREHMDSPLLCAKAAIRWFEGYKHDHAIIAPRTKDGPMPVWAAESWLGWKEVRDTVQPETETVWIDDFLVRDAVKWAKENVGIVWYAHDAFGRKVAELGGLPLFGPGPEASSTISRESGKRSIVASIAAHGVGKDLQMFSTQLVANPPSDGGAWEQLLGRSHRPGQLADEVSALVYRHTAEMADAVEKARALAKFIQESMGMTQKLTYADIAF